MATRVMACPCTGVEVGIAKCGVSKREIKPRFTIPWFNRTKGAEYQDAKFGKGNRIHNLGGKGLSKTATCTVCGVSKAQ